MLDMGFEPDVRKIVSQVTFILFAEVPLLRFVMADGYHAKISALTSYNLQSAQVSKNGNVGQCGICVRIPNCLEIARSDSAQKA